MGDVQQPGERRLGGLSVAFDGPVATIWLDRPEKLNALAREFWPGMRALLNECVERAETRAIIVTGRGERAFCAGGDVSSFDALEDEEQRHAFQVDCMDTFEAAERCPLPIIAAVNGLALGGGTEFTMACDIVIAADTARFGMPEARLGLVPGYGILRSPHVIGRQWTNLMVMAAETVDAPTALAIGLVQKLFPADRLMVEAHALALRIAAHSRDGMRVAKQLAGGFTSAESYAESTAEITRLHSTPDGIEGRRSFLERRPPRFGGGDG